VIRLEATPSCSFKVSGGAGVIRDFEKKNAGMAESCADGREGTIRPVDVFEHVKCYNTVIVFASLIVLHLAANPVSACGPVRVEDTMERVHRVDLVSSSVRLPEELSTSGTELQETCSRSKRCPEHVQALARPPPVNRDLRLVERLRSLSKGKRIQQLRRRVALELCCPVTAQRALKD